MIHAYKLNGYNIILDQNSGCVHSVDPVAYDMITMYQDHDKEEIRRFILEKYNRLTYNHFTSLYISIYPYIFSKENVDIDLLKCKKDYKKMLKGIKQ